MVRLADNRAADSQEGAGKQRAAGLQGYSREAGGRPAVLAAPAPVLVEAVRRSVAGSRVADSWAVRLADPGFAAEDLQVDIPEASTGLAERKSQRSVAALGPAAHRVVAPTVE
jgi:hypothetical protein